MTERGKMGGTDQNNFHSDLILKLIEEKKLDEGSINSLSSDEIAFQINYYKITADKIFDDVEAKLFNLDQNFENTAHSKLVELIKTSLNEQISKKQKTDKPNQSYSNLNKTNKNEKSNPPYINNINSNSLATEEEILKIINSDLIDGIDNNNLLFNTESDVKNLKFKVIQTYDEDNNILSERRNDNEIKLNFFEEKNTKEYPIVPINEGIFMEKFKEYFSIVKESLKENYFGLIGKDANTLEIDKMILLVLFENTEGKPSSNDLGFFDPLNNFKKFTIRDEDLNALKDFYFFNGQIVMIEGDVDNSNTITLRDIRNGFVPDSYNLDYEYVMNFFKNSSPYCVYALNGPYSSKNDLSLNNFKKALKKIADDKPHLVIFSGPFVSYDNDVISKENEIKLNESDSKSLTHHQIFETILEKINETFSAMITNVIICPSLLDTTNIYPIPQPAFNTKYLKNYQNFEMVKKGRIKMICNPNTFNINEIIASVANFDFTKEMINSSYKSSNKNPLESSLEMIINQRSFFPLLPSLIGSSENDKSVVLEYSKLSNIRINETPDIIFTTSETKAFVKKIKSTLFINLGSFYKSTKLGNIGKIMIFSPKYNSKNCDIIKRLKVELFQLDLE